MQISTTNLSRERNLIYSGITLLSKRSNFDPNNVDALFVRPNYDLYTQ